MKIKVNGYSGGIYNGTVCFNSSEQPFTARIYPDGMCAIRLGHWGDLLVPDYVKQAIVLEISVRDAPINKGRTNDSDN